MAKCIMIQGTMSNAGKSFLVAGICRILKQDGYRVAPFKSQNMALNSYITEDGLEMGRAQVMQAEACGREPSVYMNPILLKPTTDVGSQVIVNGVPRGNMKASDYFHYKTSLVPDILSAYQKLAEDCDVIVIEGAGSPAEINLKQNDIVNMGLAELVDAPVLLVGDIDRGGVFAQLAGTLALLDEPERQRIKGFVMNKFRGDAEILRPGLDMLKDQCHIDTIGVIPYTCLDLDDEDSLSERLEASGADAGVDGAESGNAVDGGGKSLSTAKNPLRIAVIRFPRISNFTDFNVLQAMDGVSLTYVTKPSELRDPHMILLPGTKSTIADLVWLRTSGLEAMILKLHSRGVTVFGICGGFQMLGETISDPLHVECEGIDPEAGTYGHPDSISGIGLLPFATVFSAEKVRRRVSGTSGRLSGDYADASGKKVSGYEIHMGRTDRPNGTTRKDGPDRLNRADGPDEPDWMNNPDSSDEPEKSEKADGHLFQNGDVFGTYLHGIFDEQEFRESFLGAVAGKNGITLAAQKSGDYRSYKETQYDRLADAVRGGMDMKKLYEILGLFPEKYFPRDGGGKTAGFGAGAVKAADAGMPEDAEAGTAKMPGPEEGLKTAEAGAPGRKDGLVHVYYGDGKGKTTAAVGLAVRAAGAGKKVVFCQFLKSAGSAELAVLGVTPGIRILRSEERFGFSWTLTPEQKSRLRAIHTDLFAEAMRLVQEGRCDVLVLDEILDALRKDLIDGDVFYRYFDENCRKIGNADPPEAPQGAGAQSGEAMPRGCEWILTGREPDAGILAAADYVTHMEKERHPFDRGVRARRGIEY